MPEPCPPKPSGQLFVAAVVEEAEAEAHVEVERPNVSLVGGCDPLLVDEQGGNQAANHHDVVEQIAELRGDVQPDGLWVRALTSDGGVGGTDVCRDRTEEGWKPTSR